MPGTNNWFSSFSLFEADRHEAVPPLVPQGRDPRFYDDSLDVFSKDLIVSPISDIPWFHIYKWGEDRWPAGRAVYNRKCDGVHVLHFVVGGKGLVNGIPVQTGTAFMTDPQIPYSMEGDEEEPLRYYWILIRNGDELLNPTGLLVYGDDGVGRFDFSPCYDDVCRLCRKGLYQTGDRYTIMFGLYSLLCEILSRCCAKNPRKEADVSPYVKRALEYIRENYAKDISVNAIADQLYLSRTHLRRLFLRDLGITPKDQIALCRVEAAVALMNTLPDASMAQIASAVGYSSYSQFIQAFRKHYGCTPGEYGSTSRICLTDPPEQGSKTDSDLK